MQTPLIRICWSTDSQTDAISSRAVTSLPLAANQNSARSVAGLRLVAEHVSQTANKVITRRRTALFTQATL